MFIRIYKFQDQNVLNNSPDFFLLMQKVFKNSTTKKEHKINIKKQLKKPIISTHSQSL